MSRRQDEEYAKDRFDAWLHRTYPGASIQWQDGDDPPDYYLILDGRHYAVEVTTISGNIAVENTSRPRRSIEANRERFAEEAEQEAQTRGILHGTYYLGFGPVEQASDFQGRRHQIMETVLEHIRDTQSENHVPWKEIKIDGKTYCTVLKANDNAARVTYGAQSPELPKWEGEINEQTRQLLQEIIDDKRTKLAAFTDPKVLLLLHDYPWIAAPEHFRAFVSALIGLEGFELILVIGGSAEAMIHQRSELV